jgi:hypothetical protein
MQCNTWAAQLSYCSGQTHSNAIAAPPFVLTAVVYCAPLYGVSLSTCQTAVVGRRCRLSPVVDPTPPLHKQELHL